MGDQRAIGRTARKGLAMLPAAVIAADEATVVKNRRRVSDAAPRAMTAIGPPPSNHRGGSCPRRLTDDRHFDDGCVTPQLTSGSRPRKAQMRDRYRPVIGESSIRHI
jgi:hypothetical protein